jgi:hypothetical protein
VRTTVAFDPDVSAAIAELRQREDLGVSEAVNELIRRGLQPRRDARPFVQTTHELGLTLDVSNVADALGILDEADSRR